MNCSEMLRLLDADIDGELDLAHHLELHEHLRTCPSCQQRALELQAQRKVLREKLPRFTASHALTAKIRASLRAETEAVKPEPAKQKTAPPRNLIYYRFRNLSVIAAGFLLALFLGISWGTRRAHHEFLLTEAISDHVRSMQIGHLTDVLSTDQHTVKPWFAGKLDFSPPVVDLAAEGFPLTGGRLEQFDGRNAAALVYHRRQHVINLFIWPAGTSALSTQPAARDGYHLQSWSRDGFNFIAISEIPAADLAEFSETFQRATR